MILSLAAKFRGFDRNYCVVRTHIHKGDSIIINAANTNLQQRVKTNVPNMTDGCNRQIDETIIIMRPSIYLPIKFIQVDHQLSTAPHRNLLSFRKVEIKKSVDKTSLVCISMKILNTFKHWNLL